MKKLAVLMTVAMLASVSAQAAYITAATDSPGTPTNAPLVFTDFSDGDRMFQDRDPSVMYWTNIPAPLLGADYVATCNCNNKTQCDPGWYEVTFSAEATIAYLFVDDRVIGDPDDLISGWMVDSTITNENGTAMTFSSAGYDIYYADGANIRTSSVFEAAIPEAGTYRFHDQSAPPSALGSEYGIAAIPEPGSMALLAVGGLMLLLKRRR